MTIRWFGCASRASGIVRNLLHEIMKENVTEAYRIRDGKPVVSRQV